MPVDDTLKTNDLIDIDVEDWRSNTVYEGEYAAQGENHEVVRWFWEIVLDFCSEDRARLLQFATGATHVPAQGFCALHHGDGSIRLFTLQSVPLDMTVFPKAHTCFNRIDLPLYGSKEDMRCTLLLRILIK